MSTEVSKFSVFEDPSIFGDSSNDIIGFGNDFPSNPKDGFMFILTSKERKQKFIYDGINEVWQEVGNDSTNYDFQKRILAGTFSTIFSFESDIYGYDGSDYQVPAFHDINCTNIGPFSHPVDVYADGGEADDDMFVFEGSDPTIYSQWPPISDKIWYTYNGHGVVHRFNGQKLCTVPSGKIFSVMLVDTSPNRFLWNGTVTIKPTSDSLDLKQYAINNNLNYEKYALFREIGEVETKVDEYQKSNLPSINLNQNGIIYKFYGVN